MLKVLEPRYAILSHSHFRTKIEPELCKQEKNKIFAALSNASYIAITRDEWTSWATESYVIVTAHYITAEWEMRSPVLQTRQFYESHTSTNLAQTVLIEAVAE